MTTNTDFPIAPLSDEDVKRHAVKIARVVNNMMKGHLNAIGTMTLAISATSTTIVDQRIGGNSFIGFTPLTANAATIAASIYIANRGNGSATIHHSSSANTDMTFSLLIIG